MSPLKTFLCDFHRTWPSKRIREVTGADSHRARLPRNERRANAIADVPHESKPAPLSPHLSSPKKLRARCPAKTPRVPHATPTLYPTKSPYSIALAASSPSGPRHVPAGPSDTEASRAIGGVASGTNAAVCGAATTPGSSNRPPAREQGPADDIDFLT
jgi:hypothetical protein